MKSVVSTELLLFAQYDVRHCLLLENLTSMSDTDYLSPIDPERSSFVEYDHNETENEVLSEANFCADFRET